MFRGFHSFKRNVNNMGGLTCFLIAQCIFWLLTLPSSEFDIRLNLRLGLSRQWMLPIFPFFLVMTNSFSHLSFLQLVFPFPSHQSSHHIWDRLALPVPGIPIGSQIETALIGAKNINSTRCFENHPVTEICSLRINTSSHTEVSTSHVTICWMLHELFYPLGAIVTSIVAW